MSSTGADPFLTLLLHPGTWVVLLVVWLWFWHNSRTTPYIHPKFDKKRNRPGDYVADGSTATSKMEMRVRNTIIAAGYRPLRQGTGLIIPGKDASGSLRRFTPDIIIHHPKKVIVEVDPLFWHGSEGPHKIYEDMERNKFYSMLGFAVVRVRIGWKGNPHARLSKYDMVTEQGDFYPDKHATELYAAIRRARPLHRKYWDKEMAKLLPSYEAHKNSRGQTRQQSPQQAYPPPNPGYGYEYGYGQPPYPGQGW